MSPRLPSGALLALTAAMTAGATAICAALPAPPASATPATAGLRAAPGVSADQVRGQEWWLTAIHVTQAWQSSKGAGITVAVLSTGVNPQHPDLTGSVLTGPDLTGSGRSPGGLFWGIEGTSAASVIAGHGDSTGNASGLIGIAPAAKILSLRVVLDATDPLYADASLTSRLPAAIAQGIRYAADHGARVIDLPLDPGSMAADGAVTGGLQAAAGGSAAERAAVSYAIGKGAVLVAPAGDNGASGDGGDGATFPASYPDVVAFGAVDRHFSRAQFSNRQSFVAATAPGVDVTAAGLGSGYRTMTTTDAASAMAAGVAALIRSRYPALTPGQVRQALVTGTVNRPAGGSAPGDGTGTLDALKAMQAAAAIATGRAATPSPQPRPTGQKQPAPLPRPKAKSATDSVVKAFLRDAAVTAGALILLLVVVLLLIALWRRRPGRRSRAFPEPRTLLAIPAPPPPGPPGGARHARLAAAEQHALAVMPSQGGRTGPRHPAAPSAGGSYGGAPYPAAPQAADPFAARSGAPSWEGTGGTLDSFAGDDLDDAGSGANAGNGAAGGQPRDRGRGRFRVGGFLAGGRSGSGRSVRAGGDRRARRGPRAGAHGGRMRVTPASRATTRSQVPVPGGPPWAPASMPENNLPPEQTRGFPERAAPPALPGPPAPASTVPGPPVPGPALPGPAVPRTVLPGPAIPGSAAPRAALPGPAGSGPAAPGPGNAAAADPGAPATRFPLGPPVTVGPSPRPVRPSTLGPPSPQAPGYVYERPAAPGAPYAPMQPPGLGQMYGSGQQFGAAQGHAPGQAFGATQPPAPGQPYGTAQAYGTPAPLAPGQSYGAAQTFFPGQTYGTPQPPGSGEPFGPGQASGAPEPPAPSRAYEAAQPPAPSQGYGAAQSPVPGQPYGAQAPGHAYDAAPPPAASRGYGGAQAPGPGQLHGTSQAGAAGQPAAYGPGYGDGEPHAHGRRAGPVQPQGGGQPLPRRRPGPPPGAAPGNPAAFDQRLAGGSAGIQPGTADPAVPSSLGPSGLGPAGPGPSGYTGPAATDGLVRPEGSATPTEPVGREDRHGPVVAPRYSWNPGAPTEPFPAPPPPDPGEPAASGPDRDGPEPPGGIGR